MTPNKKPGLPLGTTETYVTMHKWLRRGFYVCLSALVIEGTFTVPLLFIWMGWPTLSPLEICSEMNKVRFSDDSFECEFPYPLFEESENEGRKTAQDKWGIQPTPLYRRIGFRDLVKFRDERLARQAAARAAEAQRSTIVDLK
jgi:hypothetical protein